MALYVIADLHLSLGADKPMDVFGGRWEGYMDKLREGLAVIGPEDTTVLPGDLSWALGRPRSTSQNTQARWQRIRQRCRRLGSVISRTLRF